MTAPETFIAFAQLHTGKAGYSGMSNVHSIERKSAMFHVLPDHDIAVNVDRIEWVNHRHAWIKWFTLWDDAISVGIEHRRGGGALFIPKEIHPGDRLTFAPGSIQCDG